MSSVTNYKITLFPGDTMWSPNGTHICDATGFTIIASVPTTIELEDYDKYCHVYEYLANERSSRGICLGYSNINVWVTTNSEYTLPNIKQNTFLIPHPTWSNVYMPKASQCKCTQVYAVTTGPINFDEPWVTKQQPKTNKKEVITINNLYNTSNVSEVVYNKETDKYILTTTIHKIPIMESVNVYDETGAIVFQKQVQKIERIVENVDEQILDENGKVIMEDVLDQNGDPILEPKIPEKYFNGNVEIERNEYLLSGGIKAIYVSCSLLS